MCYSRAALLFLSCSTLLCGVGSAGATGAVDASVLVSDVTPGIAAPAGWSYAHSPGTYFWNGVRTGFGIVAFCFVLSGLRSALSDREDL